MAFGMSYDEFWYMDPWRAVAYRKAHRMKVEMRNQELWLQGLYNNNAMSVAIGNALSKQKQKYIQQPIQIFKPTEEEQKAKIDETRCKLVEKLNAWKDQFDRAKGKS